MRKVLILILSLAIVFTFSFSMAFAAPSSLYGTFTNSVVETHVNSAINQYKEANYFVYDWSRIVTLNDNLRAATYREANYNNTVKNAIANYQKEAAKVTTVADQKTELAKVKKAAVAEVKTNLDEIMFYYNTYMMPMVSPALSASYLSAIQSYVTFFEDAINSVDIMNLTPLDVMDQEGIVAYSVNLAKAKTQIENITDMVIEVGDFDNYTSLINEILMFNSSTASLNSYADVVANTYKAQKSFGTTTLLTTTYDSKTVDTMLELAKHYISTFDLKTVSNIDAFFTHTLTTAELTADNIETLQAKAILEITTGEYDVYGFPTADQKTIKDIQAKYVEKITGAETEAMVNYYVGVAKNAMDSYDTIAEVKAKEAKAKEDALKAAQTELEKAYVASITDACDNILVTVRTEKVKKGTKVVVKSVENLPAECEVVYYNFYRAEKVSKNYVAKLSKKVPDNSYINTSGKKGTRYYYKATVTFMDKYGNVYTTELDGCKAGYRTFK